MLEFRNISIYRQNRRVLDDFNLKVQDGTILGLLGSDNGARSMILSAASGSQAPDYGQILLDEVSIYGGKNKIYQKVGYMPQEYGFYDTLRVEEYFELFLSLYKVNGRYRQKRMDEVARLFDFESYMTAFIMELPVEILPFLCLAKTVLHDPEWIFLDEPFAGLSSVQRYDMMKILLILQEQGKSMVVNSQFFPENIDFFTHIAIIEDGKVVMKNTTEDIFELALRKNPVRMHVLAGMDEALGVLKDNALVDRVTVDDNDVIFRFNGGEREEAELLTDLVAAGAFIQNYMRDRVNIEETFRR
ncbi:MAG: ABC transporter ATP-binding protein [Clostridiales bacterium]|nr:ABC transporter ATP-binding protein [Clostridiales bacterium]